MFGDLLQNVPLTIYMVVSATNEQTPITANEPLRMHMFPDAFATVEDAEAWIMEYGYPDVFFSAITYNIVEYVRPPF